MLVRFVALAFGLAATAANADAKVTSHLEWVDPIAMGVSGLEVLDDGARFVAVTDRGWFLEGAFERTEEDALRGVRIDRVRPILDHNGLPAAARRVRDWADAEGLTFDANGALIVGFERWMHVGRYTDTAAIKDVLVGPRAFRDYFENRQIEAVATHPDGRIFVWPERPLVGLEFDTYVYDDEGWNVLGAITEVDGFSIVGADFTSDGTLYLLERKLILARWWQNRVRRIDALDLASPEIVWTSGRNDYYNLEGLAVVEGDMTRLILIGDNNNQKDNPTDIVEITLTD